MWDTLLKSVDYYLPVLVRSGCHGYPSKQEKYAKEQGEESKVGIRVYASNVVIVIHCRTCVQHLGQKGVC